MNQDLQQNVFSTSQALADRGEYEQALSCLNTMECVMASWMKGQIYLSAVEQLSNNFRFMFYPTMEMKLKYRELLAQASDHLYNAALQLPGASSEIKENLNKNLWHQIAKVENEIATARTEVEEKQADVYEEENFSTDNLINEISEWTLR